MTLFRIDRPRGAEALRRLVGAAIVPVITSDRFSTYKVMPTPQVCLVHLRRDLQAMIDRDDGGGVPLSILERVVVMTVVSKIEASCQDRRCPP